MSSAEAKLFAAFLSLRDDGYFAEREWACCHSCGVYELPSGTQRYVFYHSQDGEDLRNHNACYLSWGGDPELICRRLREAGLVVGWNGDRDKRIRVTERPAVSRSITPEILSAQSS